MSRTRASLIVMLMLAVVMTTMTGCGRKGIVRVNGQKISKDEFYARLERVPVQTQQGQQVAGRYVIEQMINEALVLQLAEKQGVKPDDKQIQKKIDFITKQAGGKIANVLAQRGMTMDDLKRQISTEQAFINVVTKGIKVPDNKVQAAYDQALASKDSPFKRSEAVMISGIILNSKAKADKTYGLLSAGQEFGTIAMKMSDDEATRKSQGKLAWVAKDDAKIPQVIRSTAFGLQIGKFSKPFVLQGKWLILKADQKRPAKTTGFGEVKDVIKEQLAVQEGSKKNTYQAAMRTFVKSADINVNAERYKDIAASIKKAAMKAPPKPGDQTQVQAPAK